MEVKKVLRMGKLKIVIIPKNSDIDFGDQIIFKKMDEEFWKFPKKKK